MAYDHQHGSACQSSAFGLASCQSYLDGVPFKISAAFRPQTQPLLPPEILHSAKPCEAVHEEYVFDTEEAVLAWSRAREEAKAKAITERDTAERRRAALAAAESSSSDSDDNGGEAEEERPTAGDGVKGSQPEVAAVKPPWQLPVGASLTSTILTPTPIQTAQKKVQSPLAPKASVDLALFEQEGDPFDNMELQTINDMEELRTLLGGTVEGSSQEPSPNPDSQALKGLNEEEAAQAVVRETPGQEPVNGKSTTVSSANNIFTSIPGVKMFEAKPSSSVSSCAVPGVGSEDSPPFRSSPAVDEDYVKIRPDYSQQSVHFQRDTTNVNSKSNSDGGLGGDLPPHYANSKAFKVVLPPIHPGGNSQGGDSTLDGAAGSSSMGCVMSRSTPQPYDRHSFMGAGMSQSAYVSSTSASGAVDLADLSLLDRQPVSQARCGVAASSALTGSMYSRYGNSGCESPTPVNGVDTDRGRLWSARSNPDLLARSHSPYDGKSQSSAQPWNPYRPLPPTPVPDQQPSASSPVGSPTEHRQTPSPHPQPSSVPSSAAPTPQSESDPYSSLSSEAKTFVNNLTSMGFSRPRVSRAVEKFGIDEREVLDHLLNVDTLVEKKFTPLLAETSLQLFSNDVGKAERFLGLYHQFTELGFTGDRIQTALVKHQLDRDKALDYLTT